MQYRLGVIGGGFMARAIITGACKSGFIKKSEVILSEPNPERAQAWQKEGFCVASDNRFVAENCDFLLFAVKPQVFPAVAEEITGVSFPVVLSIMAGKTRGAIASSLNAPCQIARAMPNLPCSIGEGVTAIALDGFSQEERAFAVGLFSSVGKVVCVQEEKLNAVTGVSGSGPAYVYLFLQSLISAGVENGLSQEEAKELALQTVKGGVCLAEQSEKSLAELIDAVSSKGGTTVAALQSFREEGFCDMVSHAVKKAVERAEELSK